MIPPNDIVDITGRELVKFLVVAEDYHGNIHRTQDGEFVCLLEKTAFALQECSVRSRSVSWNSVRRQSIIVAGCARRVNTNFRACVDGAGSAPCSAICATATTVAIREMLTLRGSCHP